MKKAIWRAVIEVGFIVFLFYSNLLMGEFERFRKRPGDGLVVGAGRHLYGQQFYDCRCSRAGWPCRFRVSSGQVLNSRAVWRYHAAMDCPERDQLRDKYMNLALAFSESTAPLSKSLTQPEFAKRVENARIFRGLCAAARHAWEDHFNQHRCGRNEPADSGAQI
jgi:hypothetical protein